MISILSTLILNICFVFNNQSIHDQQLQLRTSGPGYRIGPAEQPGPVATDPVVAFKTALWFWMTPRNNKSCHAVNIGQWTPTAVDVAARRVTGYGMITNIINGGVECGIGPDPKVVDRIGFYRRYCDALAVSYGNNLDCYNQRPFPSSSSVGFAAQ